MPTSYFRRGGGTARRRGAATKIAAAARGRIVRKARGTVKKIYAKPYVPKTVKRDTSIAALSRSVAQLQRAKLGQYQKQLQHANILTTAVGDSFSSLRPLCFALNCFGQPVPTGANVHMYPEIWINQNNDEPVFAGRFAVWQNSDGENGIPDQFNMWSGCNDDTISREVYQPLSASYKFSISADMVPSADPIWIRIDFIRPAKILRHSTDHEYNLPQALPGFAHLAHGEMNQRNRINQTYWKPIIKTKWIKLQASAAHTGLTTTQHKVIKRTGANFRFKDVLTPDLDQGGNTGHQWYLNVPVKKQQWCVISTSATTMPAGCVLNIERRIAWRDQHGTAS